MLGRINTAVKWFSVNNWRGIASSTDKTGLISRKYWSNVCSSRSTLYSFPEFLSDSLKSVVNRKTGQQLFMDAELINGLNRAIDCS